MTVRIDVPEDTLAVFGEDGRVFYDLDHLVSEYREHTELIHQGANIVGDDYTKGLAEGMSQVLDQISRAREVLTLEDDVSR